MNIASYGHSYFQVDVPISNFRIPSNTIGMNYTIFPYIGLRLEESNTIFKNSGNELTLKGTAKTINL